MNLRHALLNFATMLQSRYNIPQKSLEMNVDPIRLFAHHSVACDPEVME